MKMPETGLPIHLRRCQFFRVLLCSLLGPVGLVISIGVGYGTREYLKRIASRKDVVSRLEEDLKYNKEITRKLMLNMS